MPVSTEIARTLMPAASSGAILARLVSCLLRALGDANCALSVLMRNYIAKIQLVPERRTRASGLRGDLGGEVIRGGVLQWAGAWIVRG